MKIKHCLICEKETGWYLIGKTDMGEWYNCTSCNDTYVEFYPSFKASLGWTDDEDGHEDCDSCSNRSSCYDDLSNDIIWDEEIV